TLPLIAITTIRWLWYTFWGYFSGGMRATFDWYTFSLRRALAKLGRPMLILFLLGAASVLVGYLWSANVLPETYSEEERTEKVAQLQERLSSNPNLETLNTQVTAPRLFLHNVRSTLVIAFMGLFSFSVLGVIIYILNVGLIGVLLGLFNMIGYSPWPLLLAGILPHGVFEIPALMLSCAAVMHIGLTLVTPQARKTMGEVLIEAVADWTKVTLGAVVPLLALAAVVETYVTPQLLCMVLKTCP
ncbi:MAG: stage II sporulation protein M, partial [Chloroflexota bacterium]